MEKEIINAEGKSAGRTASLAAKSALLGKEVIILNCNKAIITGNKSNIIKKYLKLKQMGGSSQRGPYFRSTSEQIMKRIIRGMLQYKKGKGKQALKMIICYNNVPKEYEGKQGKIEKINIGMSLKELSARLKEK